MNNDIEAADPLGSERSGPEHRLLNLALHSTCNELCCYGESYKLDANADNKLDFFESCIASGAKLSDEMLAFAGAKNTEMYIDGVGLPGSCKADSKVSIHALSALVQDDGYFDAGGPRLTAAAKWFHSAATVPIIFAAGKLDQQPSEFVGALVLYFIEEPRHPEALVEYLNTVMSNASSLYSMFSRSDDYQQLLRASSVQATDTPSSNPANYQPLEIEQIEAAENTEAPKAVVKLSTMKKLKKLKKKAKPWLKKYFHKWTGGTPAFLGPLKNDFCMVAWLGSFVAIAVLQVMFDNINDGFVFRGKRMLFPLPGSFGALCTIVYALPAAPLAQPRIVLAAHTYAMTVTTIITSIFPRHHYVWLQQALSAAFTIGGMAKFGILNPPAGAVSVAVIQYYNSAAYSDGGLLFNYVATYMCCIVICLVALIIHNVLKDRTYPIAW